MARRWGLGPVFAFESLAGARRWQVYALRALLVGLLLAGLTLTWGPADRQIRTLADAAAIGRLFLVTLIVVQLAVVLLAAPAATAGAICVDKARGALLHAFVTDLSDREIVLGKIAARLAPVLMLMACGVPVIALGSFLGGIDVEAAVGAELVTAGVAILGCSLALFASVYAKRPHQALILTFFVMGVWVAAYPAIVIAFGLGPPVTPLDWFWALSNPFVIAILPITEAQGSPVGGVGLRDQVIFSVITALVGWGLVGLATWRIRPVVLGQMGRPARPKRPDAPARLVNYLPGPPLDGNPVLWREWHRKRPSRWTGRFWTAYAVASGLASLVVLSFYYVSSGPGLITSGVQVLAAQVNAWQVAIGLLLLSVSAASALAEERDRGSLDVIMATDLTTREIVWGKWWGTFAMVPRLAILPIWVAAGAAMVGDGWVGLALMIGLILAYAAAITSLGLALATWIPRLGRVTGLSVLIYVLVSIGWVLAVYAVASLPVGSSISPGDRDGLALASPFVGVYATTEAACRLSFVNYNMLYGAWGSGPGFLRDLLFWPLFWIVVNLAVAALLMAAVLLTFDRCLGRVPDRPRPGEAPTPLSPLGRLLHTPVGDLLRRPRSGREPLGPISTGVKEL